MRRIFAWIGQRLRHLDPILFACTSVLSAISILTIWGAVDNFGVSKLRMQIAMTVLGILMTVVIANLDYTFIVNRAWILFFVISVGLLGITLIFGSSGVSLETANKSWLKIPGIGVMIQPSEFVKFLFVCSFAKHLSLVREKINYPLPLLGLAIHAGAIVGLILISGDLGVALVFVALTFIMLFATGMSIWYDIGIGAVLVGVFPFLYNNYLSLYQKKRIYYGFHPEEDPLDWGWQALYSRSTIQNGGFWGQGIFGGSYYEVLGASHTDFIFATICEKFGLVGGSITILTLLVLVLRLIKISRESSQNFGGLICLGVAGVILVQTSENIAMCYALVPVVGITLPFLSCGGSSLLATYMLVALGHSVASYKPKYYYQH